MSTDCDPLDSNSPEDPPPAQIGLAVEGELAWSGDNSQTVSSRSTETFARTIASALPARDLATHDELLELDPPLAALFLRGHDLARRASDPGDVFLLAHAGRELSRGVIQVILGEQAAVPEEEDTELTPTERNRARIGTVLQLPAAHPAVTAWFRLVGTFAESCHYRSPAPQYGPVAEAFIQFSELLYGRLAPYFTTHADLDVFLNQSAPTDDDVDRAVTLLARPQQRRYFYSNLQHPAWIAPLAERGQFSSPPDRASYPDGQWEMKMWPEGEALARFASQVPEIATEQLLQIPTSLQNPVVWVAVIEAAKSLPIEAAGRLARRVAKALRTVPAILVPHRAVTLVARLAEGGHAGAFDLVDALLWTRSESEVAADSECAGAVRLGRWLSAGLVLARLNTLDLNRFCDLAVPSLEVLDAGETLRRLLRCLDRVLTLTRVAAGRTATDDHVTHWWCESLERGTDGEDVRALLARTIAHVATTAVVSGVDGAHRAWSELEPYSGDIFERLRLWTLAEAGPLLQDQLDSVIASETLLAPPYRAKEAARLLRKQFSNASPDARAIFRYALERGPSPDEVRDSAAWRRKERPEATEPKRSGDTSGRTDGDGVLCREAIEDDVRNWRRQRLRWFHDRIPEELRDLAAAAGVTPEVPSEERQALDEVGHYSPEALWVGPNSPKSAEQLAAMPPEEIVQLLREWRPDHALPAGFSYRGLEEALLAFAERNPECATAVLRSESGTELRPNYISSLLSGVRAAVVGGFAADWTGLLSAIIVTLRGAGLAHSGGTDPAVTLRAIDSSTTGEWYQVVRSAADLVQGCCAQDRMPFELSSEVWSTVRVMIESPLTWADSFRVGGVTGFERALVDALNTASGSVTRALLEIALWEYRGRARFKGLAHSETPHLPEVEELLAPLLTALLSHEGSAARGSEAMLGQFVPQLLFMTPTWLAETEDRLFAGGAENPVDHPIWGAYVLRARFYDDTFTRLRPWYVCAAENASPDILESESPRPSREWSVTQGLVTHVFLAVVRGRAAVGQSDALVETTFSRVPARERAHAYWKIYRNWSDQNRPPSAEVVERVVRFWEWRLTTLEALSASPHRDTEAEGLLWLFKTPYLPASTVIELGRRTLALTPPNDRESAGAWERIREVAAEEPIAAFDIIETLISRELTMPYAHVPKDEIAPALRCVLDCGDAAVRARAERLIHRLGERGRFDYGDLLART